MVGIVLFVFIVGCQATISNIIYEDNASSVLSCNSNENCHVECSNDNDTYSCQHSTILCPLSADTNCSVECVDEYSCYNTTINGVSALTLYIDCDYQHACAFLTIYAPHVNNSQFTFISNYHQAAHYVMMHINHTDKVYIRCLAISSCAYMTIHVQNAHIFHGYFSRSNAFLNGAIYATNIDSMNVICPTTRACNNMRTHVEYIESMTVECDINGCQKMHINASHDTHLSVICDQCYEARISAHYADTISLECHGYDNCLQTALLCPTATDSLCSIQCETPQSCSNLTVFTANAYADGTNNVQFNCNHGRTSSYCDGATVICTELYDGVCVMSNAQCISAIDASCGVTLSPSYSPTTLTKHPTFAPSAATLQPSNHPSKASAALPTVRRMDATQEEDMEGPKKPLTKKLFGVINFVIIFGCVICCCGICFMALYFARHRDKEDNRYIQPQDDGFPNVAMTEMKHKRSNCDEKDMKMEGITENKEIPITEYKDDIHHNQMSQGEIDPPPAYIAQ